jgi:hypothetical protein
VEQEAFDMRGSNRSNWTRIIYASLAPSLLHS